MVSSAAKQTPFEELLKRIFGEDQAQGVQHLARTPEFHQALEKRGIQSTPYCAIVPQWEESLRDGIQGFDDAVKVALVRLLHMLVAARGGHHGGANVTQAASAPSGFTWEELQSLCMQASSLEPVNDKQPAPRSIQRAGKRKICWFKKYTEPGIPKSNSIFELLRANDGGEKDQEVDLTPLRLLLEEADGPKVKRKHTLAHIIHPKQNRDRDRSLSADFASPHGYGGNLFSSGPARAQTVDSSILTAPDFERRQGTAVPSPFPAIQEEPAPMEADEVTPPTLNASSSQKYAFSWKASQSPSSWTALELITLKFPSSQKEPNFTISRLTVTAWTSFDRRLILPRAQTVVRIENLSREFRARSEFINLLPADRRQAATAEADALFKPKA